MKLTLITLGALAALVSAQDLESTKFHELQIEDFSNSIKRGNIVNGQPASANQFPHQARLVINGNILCGGSLINSFWIVSAAHCIEGIRSAIAYLGSTNAGNMPVSRSIVKAGNPSSYNPITLRDDIALLKMSQAVSFAANIKPIVLPTSSQASTVYTNVVLVASGFGRTASGQVSNTLQFTTVIGISTADCQRSFGSLITSNIICVKGYPRVNQGICSGDSGGPLTTSGSNPILVGVTSFGAAVGCTAGLPQGFTRVGSYLTWINQVVANN